MPKSGKARKRGSQKPYDEPSSAPIAPTYSEDPNALSEFFSNYPSFAYDESASATKEYLRLSKSMEWEVNETAQARESFSVALTKQFNLLYGTDVGSLEAWQFLCCRVGVPDVPDSVLECRKIIARTHVNLVDLVDVARTGGTVQIFDTVTQLSKYTVKNKKYFPKENAHTGYLLKFLLRSIFNPGRDAKRGVISNDGSSVLTLDDLF